MKSSHEVRTPTHDDMLHHWRLNAEIVSAAEALVDDYSNDAAVALIAAVGALRADRARLGVCPPEGTGEVSDGASR